MFNSNKKTLKNSLALKSFFHLHWSHISELTVLDKDLEHSGPLVLTLGAFSMQAEVKHSCELQDMEDVGSQSHLFHLQTALTFWIPKCLLLTSVHKYGTRENPNQDACLRVVPSQGRMLPFQVCQIHIELICPLSRH